MSKKDVPVSLATKALAAGLSEILPKHPGIEARIKPLNLEAKSKHPNTLLQCFYATLEEGGPSIDQLVEVLDAKLLRFCTPSAKTLELEKYLSDGLITVEQYTEKVALLHSKARRTFIQSQKASRRSGEAGELLMYLLAEWALKAPQILAKMSLKTNPNMPVHGSDGIHLKVEESQNRLVFYFGESKVYKSLTAAIAAAAQSMSDFLVGSGPQNEIDLLSTHIDLSGLSFQAKQALIDVLDPYTESTISRLDALIGLFVYESQAFAEDEQGLEFEQRLHNEVTSALGHLDGELTAKGLSPRHLTLFFFPVDSVASLRTKFHQRIGWS
jgi:Cap4 SAVED domain